MKKAPAVNAETRERIFNLVREHSTPGWGAKYEPTEVFAHPVIPNLYGAISNNDWGWIVWDLNLPIVEEAPDTFCGASFLEVKIRKDGTWRYPGDPDSPVFACYNTFNQEKFRYEPSQFTPGTKVYPVLFHASSPGGWSVYDATGEKFEYWQSE